MQPKQNPAKTKSPVRARGYQRVNKIVDSTVALLRDHEMGDLTIMMIADHAGIGRSSVYEFFPTVSAIIHVIAERYAQEVQDSTRQLLVDLNSHSLERIVDALIDGTVAFFNARPAAAKIHLGSDASFSLRVIVKDFHRAGASVYHEWYKPDWAFEPLAEDDPFRTLSVLQYALFSESVQRHGCITEYFRNQTRLMAHAYLSHFTAAIQPLPGRTPAVPVEASIGPDYIVSLESGRRLKTLKRYLMANYGMSPEDYRRKWGLPPDYPMVAPSYAERRRGLAKTIKLGHRRTLIPSR